MKHTKKQMEGRKKMKIGVGKKSYRPDLNIKYFTFEVNGEIHNMHIKYTHRKRIEQDGAFFDGYPVKIIDAYPSLPKVIWMSASIILLNLKGIIKNFVCNQNRREMRKVWISKKRWKALEKRVTDLEKRTQDQPLEKIAEELADSVNNAIALTINSKDSPSS